VYCFGYGAAAPGQSYPAIYIVGYVNNVYGIWQSNDNAHSWTQIGTNPNNSIDSITTISGDANVYGQVYVGFSGSGYAVLQASGASSGPSVTGLISSPSTGDLNAGHTPGPQIDTTSSSVTQVIASTGSGSESPGNTVRVTGTPTPTLNDGSPSTSVTGTDSNALTATNTVGSGSATVSELAITQANLPNGAPIRDGAGGAANLLAALAAL